MDLKLYKIKKYFLPERILDIGANKGQFRVIAKKEFPNAEFFSIEANPNCAQALEYNFKKEYKICLLGEVEKKNVPFYCLKQDITCTGNSVYKEDSYHYNEENTYIEYLDQYTLDSLNLERFDLIKMDTQGSELDIIKGGIELCKKAKGLLLEVQTEQNNINASLKPEVNRYLESLGFFEKEELEFHTRSKQQDILYIKDE